MSASVSTCPQCRQTVQANWRLCPHCGYALTARVPAVPANSPVDRRRYRRRQVAGSNEMLSMFVGCVGAYGLLLGLLPALARSGLGYIFLAGAVLTAVLTVIFDLRSGYMLGRSLLRLGLIAAITLGLMVGVFWYFNSFAYQPFTIGLIPTPSPLVR